MPEPRTSAREKLLAAADELFYAEGIHTVGIDRVIEQAGVAKASLYTTFGSKEELVRAYLMRRHERRRDRITAAVSTLDGPRAKLLGIFDYLGEFHQLPTFRGCPFINASAESPPGGAVAEVSDLTRDWVRAFVGRLVGELGVADPDTLTEQLILLYDGCTVAARLDRNTSAARTAKAAAAALLDSYTVS